MPRPILASRNIGRQIFHAVQGRPTGQDDYQRSCDRRPTIQQPGARHLRSLVCRESPVPSADQCVFCPIPWAMRVAPGHQSQEHDSGARQAAGKCGDSRTQKNPLCRRLSTQKNPCENPRKGVMVTILSFFLP